MLRVILYFMPKIYAPVIIPTCNRYEHLKECLDSLNNNHNADKTEVYVSVDFPVSDCNRHGYQHICEYLNNTNFIFKKIYVYKQTKNLGIGSKHISNASFLVNIVHEKYDRWIFSEDDNVFSPNFLDFINEGLDKFENDKSILAICGYRFYYDLKFKDNNFIKQQIDFNAWGFGIWKDRFDRFMCKEVSYLRRIIYSPSKVFRFWRCSVNRISNLIFLSQKRYFIKGDNFFSLCMVSEKMYEIMPSISKVKNIGWDNTGIHCTHFSDQVVSMHINQKIDTSKSFTEFKGSGMEFYYENKKIIEKEDYIHNTFMKILIKFLLRLICFWK